MTPEDAIIAIKLLKPDIEWDLSLEYQEALDEAIEALSKQSASSEQVDKSVIVDFVAFQREWLNSHKTLELDAVNNALVNIFLKTTGKAFIDSLGQSAENDEDRTMDDQCGNDTEMVELKKRTITERLIIAESLIYSVIADSNQFRDPTKKTDFKPGDKFILELGQERKMFGEFEIAGTDLYVKTDLLEKLRRFDLDYTGEWIFHQDWKDDEESPYECNWCGRTFDYDMNYCGYCGAYMKRKAK